MNQILKMILSTPGLISPSFQGGSTIFYKGNFLKNPFSKSVNSMHVFETNPLLLQNEKLEKLEKLVTYMLTLQSWTTTLQLSTSCCCFIKRLGKGQLSTSSCCFIKRLGKGFLSFKPSPPYSRSKMSFVLQ